MLKTDRVGETELQRTILDALKLAPGAMFTRCQAGIVRVKGGWMHCAPAGWSDIVGCVGGRFCGLEIKTDDGVTSPEQDEFAAAVRRLGGFYAVVRSAREALDAVERCRHGG